MTQVLLENNVGSGKLPENVPETINGSLRWE